MPANGAMVITLWKDTPYSIAMLALVLLLLLIATSEGAWLEGRFGWLILAFVAALAALYRHNGPPVVLAMLLILPVMYRKYWRPLLLSLAATIALFCGVKGPLFRATGVVPAPSYLKAAPLLQHIAAHLAHATPLLPEERELLDSIYPLAGSGWPYSTNTPP